MSNEFDEFTQFDHTAAEKQLEDAKKGSDSFRLKLGVGKHRLRMLPGRAGAPAMLSFWEHSLKLPGGKFAIFTCPLKEKGRPCPACAKAAELSKSGTDADMKAAKAYMPKKRGMANFIDREHEERGPLVWTFGAMKAKGKESVYERLLFLLTDPDLGANYAHPTEGYELLVIREGLELDTTYSVSLDERKGKCPLHVDTEQALGWLRTMKDLQKLTTLLPVDEIEARMRGEQPERTDRRANAQDAMEREGR